MTKITKSRSFYLNMHGWRQLMCFIKTESSSAIPIPSCLSSLNISRDLPFCWPERYFFFLHMRCLKMSIAVSKETAVVIIIILSWNFEAYIFFGIYILYVKCVRYPVKYRCAVRTKIEYDISLGLLILNTFRYNHMPYKCTIQILMWKIWWCPSISIPKKPKARD